MNVNEKILDKLIEDSIDIQRYEATVQRKVIKQLKSLENKVVSELKDSSVITTVNKQSQNKKLKVLLKKTRDTIGVAYKEISASQIIILKEVAQLSELQTVSALNGSLKVELVIPAISQTQLNVIASSTLIEGAPTKQWWSRKSSQFRSKFEDTIRIGMIRGETTDVIVKSLIGTKANQFKDGAFISQKRGAEAVVRSSIQTVANTARLETYQNNRDILKGIQWSSTFDNRTSPTCQVLDGMQWDMDGNPLEGGYNDGRPFPGATAHWNCRSSQISITKSWEELGSKVKAEVPVGTRASMDGQVAGGQTYEKWLGGKSKSFQQEVMGKEKQKLWSEGKVGFTDLVSQTGNPLTLAQVRRKIK